MIRRYEINDISPMLDILQSDLKETIYKDMKFSRQKLTDILTGNVKNSQFFLNVAIDDEKIVGGLCAIIGTPLFSWEAIAYDHFFYIKPEKRAMGLATELVATYVEWAKERRVRRVTLSNSMGRNVEQFARLASRHGFEQVGSIHSMEL